MSDCRIVIEGVLPRTLGLARRELRAAAEAFAARSAARIRTPFRAVTIILQDDAFSAETHAAINGAEGPTDVTTQRYDPMPGEAPGVYGELYVNCDQALRVAPRRRGWSAAKELLLYVAHGMDHLSGADDLSPRDYDAMRRRELAWLRACVGLPPVRAPRVLVFNGWAAGAETWALTTFRRDWTFSYLELMEGLPEKVLDTFDDVVLVGFSMGGNQLMRLLPKYAPKVRGLVFVSTTPRMMEEDATGWRGLSERRLAALRLGTQMLFRDNPSPLYEPANLDRGLDFLRTADCRAEVRRVAPALARCPVAVFQSERDGIVRPENATWLKDVFPQARVTMVPGNEHVLPVKVPALIDATVCDILQECEDDI